MSGKRIASQHSSGKRGYCRQKQPLDHLLVAPLLNGAHAIYERSGTTSHVAVKFPENKPKTWQFKPTG
jgi:hypothetical protein